MANGIFDFLDRVTDAVEKFAPIATSLGIPFVETVSGWADTAVDIAKNALERKNEAKIVLSSQDEDEINRKIAALQATNNALADYIKNS